MPDDPEDYSRWCRYLALYKPMVENGSVVHMELQDSAAILSPIPQNVFLSLFTNENQYLVASNMTAETYALQLRDTWLNRVTGEPGRIFTVPPKRMIFLKLV